MSDIIVGIDVGTSKVCTIIGKINNEDEVDILGKGIDFCSGIKKGIIVDIDATAASIENSVKMAEAQSEMKIVSAYVNISGLHLDIINHKVSTNINNENKEISKNDVQKLIYSAGTIPIATGCEIIDVVPRQFIVDGYDGINNPVGMKGTRLEGDFDVVIGKIISVQNIVTSMQKAGLKVDGIISDGLATGESALLPDEKDMGVILIDIGGGTTEISAFKDKKLALNKCIPVGGDHITNDLSIALKIPYAEAEKIKRQFQLSSTSLIKNDLEVSVNDISESFKKNIKVSDAIEIIEARVSEIFSICNDLLNENSNGNFGAGVVLTGNGIIALDGATQLANMIFEMPVRIATPKIKGNSSLEYSTAIGIVKYIANQDKEASTISLKSIPKNNNKVKKEGFIKKTLGALRDFFC